MFDLVLPAPQETAASPVGITGSLNTTKRGRKPRIYLQSALFDYYAFTIPETTYLDGEDAPNRDWQYVVEHVLQMEPSSFHQQHFGMARKYRSCVKNGNITISFDGIRAGMGCHVEFTGQGCREWEYGRDAMAWHGLIQRVFDNRGHHTRLDLAIDDTHGYIKMSRIAWHMRKSRHLVQRKGVDTETIRCRLQFDHWRHHGDRSAATGELLGDMYSYGDRGSLVYVRIYDKTLDNLRKGRYDAVHQLREAQGLSAGERPHHIRCEVELRRKYADLAAMDLLFNPAGVVAASWLFRQVKFVDECDDSNFSRWPVSKWWLRFLGHVEHIDLGTEAPERSVEKSERHIEKAYGATLAMIHAATGFNDRKFLQWVMGIVNRSYVKLKGKHLALIQSALGSDPALRNIVDDEPPTLYVGDAERVTEPIRTYHTRLMDMLSDVRRISTPMRCHLMHRAPERWGPLLKPA